MPGPLDVTRAGDLDRTALLEIAHGRSLRLSPQLLDDVAARRADVEATLAGGAPVYGVTTGLGARSEVALTAGEQASHQQRLLLARAVGGPPWLPRADVRALVAVRLRTFLEGDAGVTPALCQALVELLEADVVPAVPATGAGSAGEIIPLAHAFQVLTGVGSVLRPDGSLLPAADAGLWRWQPAAKEGIALIAGVPGTTALALRRGAQARALVQQWLAVAATTVVAIGASPDPYRVTHARGDDVLADVLHRFADLTGLSTVGTALQAPVSMRVVGPVAAHLQRRTDQLDQAVDRALHGVTDSPAYSDNGFYGTAGFYGLDLAAALDSVTVALVHAAAVSCARLHRLLDGRVTGLPSQLTPHAGAEAGLVVVHKRAVAVVHRMHRAAVPTTVGSIETSLGQEDVQTFSWEAAEQARIAVDGLVEVLSCELLAARHALRLSGRPVPEALGRLVADVDAVVPEITGDRPFGVDIEAVREVLRVGPQLNRE